MSTLKFWNKQNSNNNNAANQNGGSSVVENGKTGSGGRNWLHQPDALTNGHVAYLVKVSLYLTIFIGSDSRFNDLICPYSI